MSIRDLVTNNQIASHLVAHWIGNVSGYNLAYYLSRGNMLNKELNGLTTGLGLGLACNIALHTWINGYVDNNEEGDITDNAEFVIELIDRIR